MIPCPFFRDQLMIQLQTLSSQRKRDTEKINVSIQIELVFSDYSTYRLAGVAVGVYT